MNRPVPLASLLLFSLRSADCREPGNAKIRDYFGRNVVAEKPRKKATVATYAGNEHLKPLARTGARSYRARFAFSPGTENRNAKISDRTSCGGDGRSVGISTTDVHWQGNDRWQRICGQSFRGAVLRTRS